MIFILILLVCVIGYIVIDCIVADKSLKMHNNKIVKMLEKVYDTAEIFIIGIFTSLFSWDDDIDDDLDTKTK